MVTVGCRGSNPFRRASGRSTADHRSAHSRSLGFTWIRFGGGDIRASIEGAAIRVPHPCHSSACIVVVYIGTATRRRQVFSRLLGKAVENLRNPEQEVGSSLKPRGLPRRLTQFASRIIRPS